MNRKLREVISFAVEDLRGAYAANVVRGRQRWSGADLQGKARKFGASYARQRRKARAALEMAGGDVIATEHGRLRTAVQVCVDDYGREVYATHAGYAVVHTASQCKHI